MLDLDALLVVAIAFAVLVASPGPATLAVATYSMSQGRRHGLLFGVGLSVGHIFWGLIAATGIGAILQAASGLLIVLKFVGGMYLFWLAISAVRACREREPQISVGAAQGHWFLRGLLLNLSNPKVVAAWMATLSLGTHYDQSFLHVAVATILCIALAFATNIAYAFIFSTKRAAATYAKARRWVQGCAAVIVAGFGMSLIGSALNRTP